MSHRARPLLKASSLVLNVVSADASAARPECGADSKAEDAVVHVDEGEIVPDSEEERMRLSKAGTMSLTREVIEISSDEDSMDTTSLKHSKPVPCTPKQVVATLRARRIIQSSDSGDSEDGARTPLQKLPRLVAARRIRTTKLAGPVIDLTTDSSGDEDDAQPDKAVLIHSAPKLPPVMLEKDERPMPLFADDSSGEEADPVHSDDDGAILTLDEPRSARKPIHRITPSTPGQRASRPSPAHGSDNESDPGAKSRVAKRTPAATPRKAGKAPRLTKKALEAAEQKRREGYAQELFDELNKVVFGGGLPAETQLKWSKRLLTTAGRARWHKSRHGVQTSEIELAVKILDSDERIRNTLSHEMCHLACWIINEDPKEAHGPKFRSWARKVMRVRPDMEITTRHDYEIAYKYEWKCQQCDKIYGRHSKSIRPDECVCGACKVGQLIPLFNTRVPKTPRSKISSRLAAERGLASPLVVSSPVSASISVSVCETPHISTPTRGGGAKLKAIMLTGSSDEDASDVEVLAHVLGDVSITGTRAA